LADQLLTTFALSILDPHHKTIIILACFIITIAGWWAWQFFLSGAYSTKAVTPYAVRDGFTSVFGPDPAWWLTLIVVLGTLTTGELAYRAIKRTLVTMGLWNWDPRRSKPNAEEVGVEVWQEMEKDPAVKEMLKYEAASGCA
jgi:phospholipid-translocating ATPase